MLRCELVTFHVMIYVLFYYHRFELATLIFDQLIYSFVFRSLIMLILLEDQY